MKIYFIFNIKNEFISLYKDNSRILYNILRQIYYLDKTEVEYGYNLFKQLTLPIEKAKLDTDIFIRLHREIPYIKRKQTHIYNNLYKDEVSKLTIKGSYIKLELDQDFSYFFNILKDYSNNFFVCEFHYQDFFFLNDCFEEEKTLV